MGGKVKDMRGTLGKDAAEVEVEEEPGWAEEVCV